MLKYIILSKITFFIFLRFKISLCLIKDFHILQRTKANFKDLIKIANIIVSNYFMKTHKLKKKKEDKGLFC